MNIQDKEKFPKNAHFAALVFTSETHYTPGDERSRTNPGHGYPESWDTIKSIKYQYFESKAEMEKWVEEIERRDYSYGNKKPIYQLIECKPLNPKVKLSLEY